MFVWCTYCQQYLGEAAPYRSHALTHGICSSCEATLERDIEAFPVAEERLELFRAMQHAAYTGDLDACSRLIDAGLLAGMRRVDIAVGIVQPLLEQVGDAWAAGELSVEEEHLATEWCETFLARLPRSPLEPGPVDLLALMPPDNLHTIGIRLATMALNAEGFRARHVMPALPIAEMLSVVRRYEPRFVGFSCAQPRSVSTALRYARQLRAAGYGGGVVLAGGAFRDGDEQWDVGGAIVCRTLADVVTLLGRPRQGERAHVDGEVTNQSRVTEASGARG